MKIIWEGDASEVPEEYRTKWTPAEDMYVLVFEGNNQVYMHQKEGPIPAHVQQEMNRAMSRGWDSLPFEKKLEINAKYEKVSG